MNTFLLVCLKISQSQILPGAAQAYTCTEMSEKFLCAALGTTFWIVVCTFVAVASTAELQEAGSKSA